MSTTLDCSHATGMFRSFQTAMIASYIVVAVCGRVGAGGGAEEHHQVRLIFTLVPVGTAGTPPMLGLWCSMCGAVHVSVLVVGTRHRRMLGPPQSG